MYKKIATFFQGVVFKATDKFISKLRESKKKKGFYEVSLKTKDDVEEMYGQIVGDWLSYMYYNENEIYNFNKIKPYVIHTQDNRLPSDSLYREDALLLKANQPEQAQVAKDKLENI